MTGRTTGFLYLLCISALSTTPAWGHHGKDYLVTASSRSPHNDEIGVLLYTTVGQSSGHHGVEEHAHEGEVTTWSFEPAVLYGLSDNWAAEVHLHQSLAEGTYETESLAFETSYHFLTENSHHGPASTFSLAAMLEYNHQLSEGDDRIEARMILAKTIWGYSITGNIITSVAIGGEQNKLDFDGILGLRRNFSDRFGATLEFSEIPTHLSVTPGISIKLPDDLDILMGATIATGDDDNNFNFRALIAKSF